MHTKHCLHVSSVKAIPIKGAQKCIELKQLHLMLKIFVRDAWIFVEDLWSKFLIWNDYARCWQYARDVLFSHSTVHSRFWRGTFGVLLPWSIEKVLQFGSTIVVLYFAVQFLYCYLEVQFLYFILLYNFCTSNLLYNNCTTICCTTFVPPFWSTVFIPLADSTIFVQFLRSAFFLQVLSTITVQLFKFAYFHSFFFRVYRFICRIQ